MYRKLSEFEIQFNRWLGKLLSLIPLFCHKKVTEKVVDSRRRWFHWAAEKPRVSLSRQNLIQSVI